MDETVITNYHRFDIAPFLGVGVKLLVGLGLSLRAYPGLANLN
jgi:hypothetical protein